MSIDVRRQKPTYHPIMNILRNKKQAKKQKATTSRNMSKYNLNFHPLEVVSRYRDPQLQVAENYSYLFNLRQ